MPVGNKFAESQGLNYVPNDVYLQKSFKGSTPLDFSNLSSSGIMSQATIPRRLQYIPQGGEGDGPPTGPAVDNSQFDYEYDALGGVPNSDNVGLTEEEQAALDKQIAGPKLGKMGTLATIAGMFTAPLSTIGYHYRRNKKINKELEEKTRQAGIQADFEREAAKGNSGADFTGGRYDGADTKSAYDAEPTAYSGSSKDGGLIGYGGKSGTPRYQQYLNGGRVGYFFGGRVNYKAGGRTDAGANRSTASKAGVGQINEAGNKVDGGNYNDGGNNNLSSTVDINKKIKEKINERLTGMIPDRVDKNQLLFDNAKRYQTLSRNKNSPFFMNRNNGPKTINKNLYTNNLTDLNLQYPDIKIENEYGMIDGDKVKSLIDQAVVEQTISPVEGLNLTRSIDTTGTQSNTSGDYTMGNFNFSSPNIEEGILNSKANYNLGDLNLNANLNTNDSTINDSRLGFNYGDGALTGSTFSDKDYGYTTNKLGVDKQFDIGNNFKVGLDGNYSNTIFDGKNYRNSDLTPSLNYDDGTFNANLSKEIVEGGTQPNLGIGFQKNGFYANANNLLNQDPTGTIGYQKNIGSPDGPLQFSAGGEMDPFTGQKTAGLFGKYTFANGGLASIL